jgi:PKD repeat protein
MKTITKKMLIISLAIILMTGIVNAQDYFISCAGLILDENTGFPVPDHLVSVSITTNGFINQYEYFSSETGYYQSDSLFVTGQGIINVSVIDCNQQVISFEEYFSFMNSFFIFDFFICTGTTGCQSNFQHAFAPGSFYTVYFTDLSTGEPDSWFWEFGDGNISIEQHPVHQYNSPGVYEVSLTIMNYADSCIDTSVQEILIPDTMNCENWFWYQTNDSLTYIFFGESLPFPANEWWWDFGDGSVASGQQAFHTFDPMLGESFNVTLTTLLFDPVWNDSCQAVSEQIIWTGNTVSCHAGYNLQQDSLDPFTFHFFDNSTGPVYAHWWDFGDGSGSMDPNPVHSYASPGDYQVCLIVSGGYPGFYCSDTICKGVSVGYSIDADFTFYLDTLSGQPNNFKFMDMSAGEPDIWLWSFGDGASSTEPDPVHQFLESGTYEVCLQVKRYFPNNVQYTDDFCETITTPDYFNLGGQVFLGNYPMNNLSGDTSIVDTGYAYLYRKYPNSIVPVDTNIFWDFGYYWFTDVREGNYIVKTTLTMGSLNYFNYLPTYFENQLYWNEASPASLFGEDNFNIFLSLEEAAGISEGPGSISGIVLLNDDYRGKIESLNNLYVYIFDESGLPLTFAKTGDNGEFSFDDISLGSYNLYAEVTGFITEFVMVTLCELTPQAGNIQLVIYESTTGFGAHEHKNHLTAGVFPNPVAETFRLELYAENHGQAVVEIYNLHGQLIMKQIVYLEPGLNNYLFNGSFLSSGVYLLSITETGKKSAERIKIVK